MPVTVAALRRRIAAAPLRQPDSLSCGACVAEVAATLLAGSAPPSTTSFVAAVLARHRQLTSARDARGRLQLPWPRWWGTPPWSLARHLTVTGGRRHVVVGARAARTRAIRTVDAALAAGLPVPMYVGSRALPRHVLLVVPEEEARPGPRETWTVYDPASGRLRSLPVAEWQRGRLGTGWPTPWCVVAPAGVTPRRRRAGRTRA